MRSNFLKFQKVGWDLLKFQKVGVNPDPFGNLFEISDFLKFQFGFMGKLEFSHFDFLKFQKVGGDFLKFQKVGWGFLKFQKAEVQKLGFHH